MMAWAVVDRRDRFKWWYQGGDSLGGEDYEQYDVYRLKRHADQARKAWDKAEGKCEGPHRVIRVQIQEAE